MSNFLQKSAPRWAQKIVHASSEFCDRKPRTCTELRRCTYAEGGRLESCARDPVGYKGSEWNLFEYAGAAPLEHTDPSGKSLIIIGMPSTLNPNTVLNRTVCQRD